MGTRNESPIKFTVNKIILRRVNLSVNKCGTVDDYAWVQEKQDRKRYWGNYRVSLKISI